MVEQTTKRTERETDVVKFDQCRKSGFLIFGFMLSLTINTKHVERELGEFVVAACRICLNVTVSLEQLLLNRMQL
jgi:hypothetical protein